MKKILVVSAAAALGLSAAVFAGGLPEEMPAAPVAVASTEAGPYLGIEGGYGMTNWKSVDNIVSSTPTAGVSKDNGFVGRAFLGYDINKYFAVEAGYTYFFNKAKLGTSASYNKFTTQAVDVFGKIKAPIIDDFSLYAKLGMNYLMGTVKNTGAPYYYPGAGSLKNFNVAYGAGADYSITSNVIANIEWLRYNGNKKVDLTNSGTVTQNPSYQPATDAFMIGLRYKFDA
jgi:OmpA-OmpF porin, OOP family